MPCFGRPALHFQTVVDGEVEKAGEIVGPGNIDPVHLEGVGRKASDDRVVAETGVAVVLERNAGNLTPRGASPAVLSCPESKCPEPRAPNPRIPNPRIPNPKVGGARRRTRSNFGFG